MSRLQHTQNDENVPLAKVQAVVKQVFPIVEPGFTIGFVLFGLVVILIHEDYPVLVGGALLCYWFMMAIARNVTINAETVLYFVYRIAGPAAIYMFVGFSYSVAKLSIYEVQGHATLSEWSALKECSDMPKDLAKDCYTAVLFMMRWRMTQWVFYWPINLAATILNDPIKFVIGVFFRYMNDSLVSVLETSVELARLDNELYVNQHRPAPIANEYLHVGDRGVIKNDNLLPRAWPIHNRVNFW